jgi:replicative DNA helicase
VSSSPLAGSKLPPYSLVAEKAVLGLLIREPATLPDVRRRVPGPEAFFRPEHVRLYEAILRASAPAPAPTTDELLARLRRDGAVADEAEEDALRALAAAAPDRSAALGAADVVREKAGRRRLIETATDIIHEAYHSAAPAAEILDGARRRLERLAREAPGSGSFSYGQPHRAVVQ